MNTTRLLTAIMTACALAGCYSLNRAKTPDGREHVLARNSGWFLFDYVPLVCGNASENPKCPIVVFRDDVTIDKMQEKVLYYALRTQRNAVDLGYTTDEEKVDTFIPLLLTKHEVQFSGVLEK